MYLKDHIVRVENIKLLQTLDAAQIDHRVIAMLLTCEGMPIKAQDITSILNHYDLLGSKKLSSKKIKAIIDAKQLGMEDESLPCPV